MKKITLTLLLILVSIGLFSQATVGTQVTSGVVPNDSLDNYPSHFAYFGKGGLRTVSDTTERNNILTSRREQGMMVYVEDMGKYYILKDSTGNGAWTEFNTATFEEWDTIAFGDETDVYRYSQRYDTIPIIDLDSIGIELDELGITVYQANDSICLDSVVSISKNLYVNGDLILPGGSTIYIGDSAVSLNLDSIGANQFLYKSGTGIDGDTGITRDANGILLAASKRITFLSSDKYMRGISSGIGIYQPDLDVIFNNTAKALSVGGSTGNANIVDETSSHTNPTISPHYGVGYGSGIGGVYSATANLTTLDAIIDSHEEMRWEYDTTRVYSQLFQINDELGFDDGNTVSTIVPTGDTLATSEWTKAQINDTVDVIRDETADSIAGLRGEIAALPTGVDTADTPVAGQIAYFTEANKIGGSSAFLFTSGTKTAGAFYTGTTDPTNTSRLNYDGDFHCSIINNDGNIFRMSNEQAGLSYNSGVLSFLVAGGIAYFATNSDYLGMTGGTGGSFRYGITKNTVPSICVYNNDLNTGFGRPAEDKISIIANGIEISRITSDSNIVNKYLYVDDSARITGALTVEGDLTVEGNVNDSLIVEGYIRCDSISTEKVDSFADFALEPDYVLPTLTEKEAFIKANKHLPSLKSGAELDMIAAKNNGYLSNNEYNRRLEGLVKEVEENVLTDIQKEKDIELLMKQVEELTKIVKLQQEEIEKLKNR